MLFGYLDHMDRLEIRMQARSIKYVANIYFSKKEIPIAIIQLYATLVLDKSASLKTFGKEIFENIVTFFIKWVVLL